MSASQTFLANVNNLCAHANQDASSIPVPLDARDRLAAVATELSVLDAYLPAFRSIHPPATLQSGYQRFVANLVSARSDEARVRAAMLTHNRGVEQRLESQAARVAKQSAVRVAELGLAACAQDVPSTRYRYRTARQHLAARLDIVCAPASSSTNNYNVDEAVASDQFKAGRLSIGQLRVRIGQDLEATGASVNAAATQLERLQSVGTAEPTLHRLIAAMRTTAAIVHRTGSTLIAGQRADIDQMSLDLKPPSRDAARYGRALGAARCAEL